MHIWVMGQVNVHKICSYVGGTNIIKDACNSKQFTNSVQSNKIPKTIFSDPEKNPEIHMKT